MLLELCCSPSSPLGAAAPPGAHVVRITESDDLCAKATIEAVLGLIDGATKLGIPVAVWAAIPCTGGSQLQRINIARYGVTAKLKHHWAQFRALWSAFELVSSATTKVGGLIALEWPLRCSYWHDRRVKRLLVGGSFHNASVAACAYGLRPQGDHAEFDFIGKVWRVAANNAAFAQQLTRSCPGQGPHHRHILVEGRQTAASAYYPPALARAVHTGLTQWASQRKR